MKVTRAYLRVLQEIVVAAATAWMCSNMLQAIRQLTFFNRIDLVSENPSVPSQICHLSRILSTVLTSSSLKAQTSSPPASLPIDQLFSAVSLPPQDCVRKYEQLCKMHTVRVRLSTALRSSGARKHSTRRTTTTHSCLRHRQSSDYKPRGHYTSSWRGRTSHSRHPMAVQAQ